MLSAVRNTLSLLVSVGLTFTITIGMVWLGSIVVARRTSDREVASSISGRSAAG